MEDLAWQYPAEPVERAALRFCEAIAKWRGKPELETVCLLLGILFLQSLMARYLVQEEIITFYSELVQYVYRVACSFKSNKPDYDGSSNPGPRQHYLPGTGCSSDEAQAFH